MEIMIILSYLVPCYCNPIAFKLRISSFVAALLRIWRWVMHYAFMQCRRSALYLNWH